MATGTGEANGVTLQPALADAWGQLQVLWEDDAVEGVFFLNPLDVAKYLGETPANLATVFGMNYVEDFLGLGTVIMNASVPKGKIYATAKENNVKVQEYRVNKSKERAARRMDKKVKGVSLDTKIVDKASAINTDEMGEIHIENYPPQDELFPIDNQSSEVLPNDNVKEISQAEDSFINNYDYEKDFTFSVGYCRACGYPDNGRGCCHYRTEVAEGGTEVFECKLRTEQGCIGCAR